MLSYYQFVLSSFVAESGPSSKSCWRRRVVLWFIGQIISTILEMYDFVSMSSKKQAIEMLRGVVTFQLASMTNSHSGKKFCCCYS